MHPKVEALSVATRPDCLSDGIIEVLADCARGIPLFVELGLQTSSDRTASVINRCYATSIYGEAVERLHSIGANVKRTLFSDSQERLKNRCCRRYHMPVIAERTA